MESLSNRRLSTAERYEAYALQARVWRDCAATFAWLMIGLLAFVIALQLTVFDNDETVKLGTDKVNDSAAYIPVIPDSIKNGTPFYSSPFMYSNHAHVEAIAGGCDTMRGRFWIHLAGLTPSGNYTAQTDWNGSGRYGYGDGGYANATGRAVYTWSCHDATGLQLPNGPYNIHFTDRTTGFSVTHTLYVGSPFYGK